KKRKKTKNELYSTTKQPVCSKNTSGPLDT
ncbi:MAG: hypothetical protein ACI8T6_001396, partial [Candidatus Poseidoniaceae archaeon]